MGLDIKAPNARAAGSGLDEPGQDLDGSGLAGGVRSQHREELPPWHSQVDIINSDQFAEILEKMDEFNHSRRGL